MINNQKEVLVSFLMNPVKLLVVSIFVYLLVACGASPEKGAIDVRFSFKCVKLVCTINTLGTINRSDTLSSLLCEMGDGNQFDLLALDNVYEHTYAAPSIYTITCSAQNSEGKTDSKTVDWNVDGVLANAGVDQTVSSGDLVTLDGSLSEATTVKPINLYRWTSQQLSITNADTAAPTFIAPENSVTKTYEVLMEVSVDNGVTFSRSSDVVKITVIPAGLSDL